MIKIKKLFIVALSYMLFMGFMPSQYASAQTAPSFTKPVIELHTTGPLKLAPNTIEIIDLQDDISSVLLSNPDHAEISVENSRRIILRPTIPGATSLTVLSTQGQVIYKRDVLVNDRHGKFVRVRRICDGDGDCVQRDTFYCPDGCYEVIGSSPTSPANNNTSTASTPSQTSNTSPNTATDIDITSEEIDE